MRNRSSYVKLPQPMGRADTGERNATPAGAAPDLVPLERKLAFLRNPAIFPDRPAAVETIETHFAWVFLSQRFVYKLKKPHRFRQVDFTSIGARRANCELEAALNRRLAEPVYIGVVPLTLANGGLALDGAGEPVDWLVHMHRLPADRTLEHLAKDGKVTDAELRALIDKLNRFYRTAALAPWEPRAYRRHVEHRADDDLEQLLAPELGLDRALIEDIHKRQTGFLRRHGSVLEARVRERRVVDAHGDLRPEHVFLDGEPQIIDCLEFSQELRWLDSAEEISFLALECERLGAADVGRRLVELYVHGAADDVPPQLLGFYRSARCIVRALLAAWHTVDDEARGDTRRWIERATWYLEQARTANPP